MCDLNTVDSRESAVAPELEITPAMVRAGVSALQEFNVNEDNLDWVVWAVYQEMAKVERFSPCLSSTIEVELSTLKRVLNGSFRLVPHSLQGCVAQVKISPESFSALLALDLRCIG